MTANNSKLAVNVLKTLTWINIAEQFNSMTMITNTSQGAMRCWNAGRNIEEISTIAG